MTAPDHSPGTSLNEPELEEAISITEYLTILLDEWRTVAFIFLVSMAAAVIYLVTVVPEYKASGVIQVSTSDTTGTEALLELSGGAPSTVETEAEILRSKRIVGQAIKKLTLALTQSIPALTLNLHISLGGKSPVNEELTRLRGIAQDLDVADWIESPIEASFTTNKNGQLEIQLGDQGKPVAISPGAKFNRQGISFTVANGTQPTPEKEIEVIFLPNDVAVQQISKNLDVSTIGGGRKDTNLVKVSFNSKDRIIARDLVNAIMDAYMAFALDWKTLRADRSAAFVEKQISGVRERLERSEKELQEFVEKTGAVLLPEQGRELIESGAELELEMRKFQIQEELLGMVVDNMASSSKHNRPLALTGDFLFEDDILGNAIGALNELEMKRGTLLSDVTESHPEVIRLNDEIRRIRIQVNELIRATKKRIGERRRAIMRSLDEIKTDLSQFPDKQRRMAALTRNLEVSQEMYKFLMSKLEEYKILKASTTVDKRIIDHATTPFLHSRPDWSTVLILATILGLLLGVGAVFARRALDPKVRDEDEAKLLANLPVYGVIPDLKEMGILRDDEPITDAVWEAPKGPSAEAFRTIRTNVEFAQVGDEPLKVLQITSSEASEGKSTIIANLAVALSKTGHKVILVDLDLRRPSQHRTFGVPRTPGISDHLVGQADMTVHPIEKFKFDLIPAGNEPPESQRLLSSSGLTELVEKWRDSYDYILLDTPPLLVADSLVISRMSDMVLFVVRPHHCRRTNLKLAQSTHERMELVKGMVINGVATRRGGYYHYYRGSYYGQKTSDTQES
ncbi:MAG: polysaccharide biosynthesis tyrosine autokinase [Proteobacteria bacterium]|nr:polysaccharide biosynthesis tyrosine autokinase [Pseudomonadota bacterium]